MAVRLESVRLSLEDDFTTGVMKAATATALLKREIKDLSGTSVQTARAQRDVEKSIDGTSRSLARGEKAIDKYSGRMRIILDAIAMLGPALVPIGAAGIPIITGLAAQMGFAAVGAGSALIAFQGFGDGLKAMNKAHLEPTVANLEAARVAMEEMSPAGRELVGQIRGLGDEWQQLRNAAQEGLFPGASDALDSLVDRLPEVENIVFRINKTIGQMLAKGADSLASDRWDDFFDYLATDARVALRQFAKTVGSVAHGLSEMWMAFDPVNDSFSRGFRDMAKDFDAWATGLDKTEGFQDFVAYLSETGPAVSDALGSIAMALVHVLEAAAPVGAAILPLLEAVFDVIGAIADSDLGGPLIAGAALMAAYTRATVLWGTVSKTSAGQFVAGQRAAVGSLLAVTSAQQRAQTSAAQLASKNRAAYATLGKGAAGIGALALATSSLGGGLDQSKTAMLGLAGAMIGPWGAAVGAGVGLILDARDASGRFADELERVDRSVQSVDLAGLRLNLARLRAEYEDMTNVTGVTDFFGDFAASMGATINGDWDRLTRQRAQVEEAEEMGKRVETAVAQIAIALGTNPFTNDAGQSMPVSLDDLNAAATRAEPALKALGYTGERLANLDASGLATMRREVVTWLKRADSAKGRTEAFASTVADLGMEALSTADSATAMSAALEALLSPNLNLSAATDAWTVALKELNEDLAKNSGALEGNGDAALKNRDAIRSRVTDMMAVLKAQAEAGDGPVKIAKSLASMRESLLKTGEAAGLSRPKLAALLRELGLTPKLVKTTFEVVGIDPAKAKAKELWSAYKSLPKDVQTDLKANGIPKTQGEIQALQKKYDLTPKQVQTLVMLKDQASGGIANIRRQIDGLRDKTVTLTTNYVTRRVGKEAQAGSYADGGFTGVGRRDEPAGLVHRGEVVIPQPLVKRDWGMLKSRYGHLPGFADGGIVGSPSKPRGTAEERLALMRALERVRELQDRLAKKGADALEGAARTKALAELAVAMKGLKEARGDVGGEARAARQKRLEAFQDKQNENRETIQGLIKGLGIGVESSVAEVNKAMRRFANQIERNGGVFSNEVKRQGKQVARTADLLGRLSSEVDKNQAAFDSATQALDAVWSERNAFSSAVSGNFSNAVTGKGLSGLDKTLRTDIWQRQAMDQAMAALVGMGLDTEGDRSGLYRELVQSNDWKTAQQLAAGGAGAVDQYEALYVQRGAQNAAAGGLAGELAYAQQTRDATVEQTQKLGQLLDSQRAQEAATNQMKTEVWELKQDMRGLVPEKIGGSVGAVINGAFANAGRGHVGKVGGR